MEICRPPCEQRRKNSPSRSSTIEGSSLQANWESIEYPLSSLSKTGSSKNPGVAQLSKKNRRPILLSGLLTCEGSEDETLVHSSYCYLHSLAKCGWRMCL